MPSGVPVFIFFKVRMSAVLRDPTNEAITHGAFPPESAELTQNCWGSIRIPDICSAFRRVEAARGLNLKRAVAVRGE